MSSRLHVIKYSTVRRTEYVCAHRKSAETRHSVLKNKYLDVTCSVLSNTYVRDACIYASHGCTCDVSHVLESRRLITVIINLSEIDNAR